MSGWTDIPQPCVILVRPQLGENIGMCARAMMNCGLTELRLVRPRDGWPNPAAGPASAGADRILTEALLFDSVEAAVADLHLAIATTNRNRDSVKPIFTAEGAARHAYDLLGQGDKIGIVFGPERTGLEIEDAAVCGATLTVPLNPEFGSLNLAQAVLLIGYEWTKIARAADVSPRQESMGGSEWAPHGELTFFINKLDEQLDKHKFYRTPELRPSIFDNLKTMFTRNRWTSQELHTLHGVLNALTGGRLKS